MSSIISSKQQAKPPARHRVLTIIIALVVLVSLGWGGWWLYTHRSVPASSQPAVDRSPLPAKTICTKEIISRANSLINDANILEMTPLVDTIKGLKDYDFDPNCMYIIVRYDIMTSNSVAAREHLLRLRRVYNKNIGYSKLFAPSTLTLADIDTAIQAMEKNDTYRSRQPDLNEIDKAGPQ